VTLESDPRAWNEYAPAEAVVGDVRRSVVELVAPGSSDSEGTVYAAVQPLGNEPPSVNVELLQVLESLLVTPTV
jgi:hypothetical protein